LTAVIGDDCAIARQRVPDAAVATAARNTSRLVHPGDRTLGERGGSGIDETMPQIVAA